MKLSKLCLGTAQLGMNYGINNVSGQPSLNQCRAIIRFAMENGITAFDTAPAYGDSEKILGRCLSELGKEAVLISKLPRLDWRPGSEEITSQIRDTLKASLSNLLIARLPICLFHELRDMSAQERLGLQALLSLKEATWVEKIGASIYSPEEAQVCLRNPDCEVIQVPFNAADKRLLEIDFVRRAKAKRKTILVRSIFLQGLFFKRDLPAELQDFEAFRQRIEAMAENEGMSVMELVFRYALSFEDIDSVIIGVDTIGQLRQNIEIARKGGLPPPLVEAITGLGTAPEYIIDPRQWPKVL
jgi:aryl-alcohol dehydrogenase-like predicted oxidoreductase